MYIYYILCIVYIICIFPIHILYNLSPNGGCMYPSLLSISRGLTEASSLLVQICAGWMDERDSLKRDIDKIYSDVQQRLPTTLQD